MALPPPLRIRSPISGSGCDGDHAVHAVDWGAAAAGVQRLGIRQDARRAGASRQRRRLRLTAEQVAVELLQALHLEPLLLGSGRQHSDLLAVGG